MNENSRGELIEFSTKVNDSSSHLIELAVQQVPSEWKYFLIGYISEDGNEAAFTILARDYDHAHLTLSLIQDRSFVIGEMVEVPEESLTE